MITAIIDVDYDDISGWVWAVYHAHDKRLIGCSYGLSSEALARAEAVKCLEEYMQDQGGSTTL